MTAVPAHFTALDALNKSRAAARHAKVLAAAVAEAEEVGFQMITRAAVASRAGVVDASVSHAFGSMLDLKRAVLTEALRTENLTIIAQGMADRPGGHPILSGMSDDLRQRAVTAMLSA